MAFMSTINANGFSHSGATIKVSGLISLGCNLNSILDISPSLRFFLAATVQSYVEFNNIAFNKIKKKQASIKIHSP